MSAGKTSLVATLVGGRYLVDQEIGAGGISTVYLARDFQAFGRNVVVKVLQDDFQKDEYIVKKFRQEAEALSRVDHPNVVSIHGRGELEDGRPYLVLQYIKGQSLRDIIVPGGIDLERAATIIRWVAHALTATHEAGVLHRDLKPENVMLQPFGDEERVVVIDFGIAQVKDSIIGHKTSLATAVGTVSYMSPEQLSGGELTPASDTFALGVIAYELITGEKPFKPSTAYQLLDEQRAGVAVPPKQLRPELHGAAQEAILRALSFDPAQRQARTRDFGNEVYRSVTGSTAPLSGLLPETFTRPVPRTRVMKADGLSPTEDYVPEPPAPAEENTGAYAPDAREQVERVVAPPVVQPSPHRMHKLLFIAVGLLLLFSLAAVAVVGFFVWKKMSEQSMVVEPSVTATPTPRKTATPASTPTPQAAATPRLSLEYSLTIQMMRDGKPYRAPLESTGRERYENGTTFRMNVSSPAAGYLYLLSEGPNDKGDIIYSVLYPTPELRGNARIEGGQRVLTPSERELPYRFQGGTGTEKIWLIWSEQPVPEMEALKGLMTEEHNWGDVTDPAQIEAVRAFLSKHETLKTEAIEDKTGRKMTINSSDEVLVHRAELEHY